MAKQCAFTIVAKNYVGLAQILEQSIRRHDNDVNFFILVADEVSEELVKQMPENVLIARECLGIDAGQWTDMSFKYNLTEFCTAIKPAAFRYFFHLNDYEKCIYLDPDIYFFAKIGKIFRMLDSCEILLTPHLLRMEANFSGDYSERGVMQTGIFNLGFCGLRRGENTMRMLEWWHARLVNYCYNDTAQGLFTDQKWMDLMPCYFSRGLRVADNLGMNLAPWNFHEREVIRHSDGTFGVRFRGDKVMEEEPLLFVHYSGFDYRKLQTGSVEQRNVEGAKRYEDIDVLMEVYAAELSQKKQIFDHFISQPYSYNFYENGESVTAFHRKLYLGLCRHDVCFENPFAVGEGSFFELLVQHKMVLKDGVLAEKVLKKNLQGVDRKLKWFNVGSRLCYRLVGLKRYLLILRLLAVFSRSEHQIQLLDKRFDTTNINS